MVSAQEVRELATQIDQETSRQIDAKIASNTGLEQKVDADPVDSEDRETIVEQGASEENLMWDSFLVRKVLQLFAEGEPEPTEAELNDAMTTLQNTEAYTFLHPKAA